MSTNLSRRNFLGAAAGAAGLSALSPVTASAVIEPEPWGMKLGIATYSLREFKDLPTMIGMLKKLQTKYVSIKDVHLKLDETPEQLEAHRKLFDEAGLVVTSGGNVDMTKGTTIEYLRPKFEYAKNARLPMMVCAPTHENIKNVEALVKEYNIRIAIHNHGPEDKHFPSPQSVLEVVNKLDKRCGLCMDIGHATRAGADIIKSAVEAGERLFDMHVKDLADPTKKESQVDIGDGVLPFPALFKQLKKMGYQGCVNMEYEINGKDPMVGMQRSLSYMRGVLAGLASV
jgi:sugar phosphate isomerase/epimerase